MILTDFFIALLPSILNKEKTIRTQMHEIPFLTFVFYPEAEETGTSLSVHKYLVPAPGLGSFSAKYRVFLPLKTRPRHLRKLTTFFKRRTRVIISFQSAAFERLISTTIRTRRVELGEILLSVFKREADDVES